MTAEVLDGRAVAAKVKAELRERIEGLGVRPRLAIVLAGGVDGFDAASEVYVRSKCRDCAEVGIDVTVVMATGLDVGSMSRLVNDLNANGAVNGIIVQLPLPAEFGDRGAVREAIDSVVPWKDVDGITSVSTAGLWTDSGAGFEPCTPAGVMRLLREYGLIAGGGLAAVVGRSDLFGKPMAKMLMDAGYGVSVLHSQVERGRFYDTLRQADIVVSGAGVPGLISASSVKPGAVLVDVGTTRTGSGLKGDFADDVWDVASYVSPVPGGVGPMTRAMLLSNIVDATTRGRR